MKTIKEEIIERYPNRNDDDDLFPLRLQHIVNCEKTAFKDGIEFAQRWIPIEEEEPKNREKVLIKWISEGKEIKSCGSLVLDSQLGKYWQSGAATEIKVTHWRPFEYL